MTFFLNSRDIRRFGCTALELCCIAVYGGPPPLDGKSAIVSTNGKFTAELRAMM